MTTDDEPHTSQSAATTSTPESTMTPSNTEEATTIEEKKELEETPQGNQRDWRFWGIFVALSVTSLLSAFEASGKADMLQVGWSSTDKPTRRINRFDHYCA